MLERPTRALLEAEAVAAKAWAAWEVGHTSRSAPLVATICTCGHKALDHNGDGCMRYADADGLEHMPCPCERYQRYQF